MPTAHAGWVWRGACLLTWGSKGSGEARVGSGLSVGVSEGIEGYFDARDSGLSALQGAGTGDPCNQIAALLEGDAHKQSGGVCKRKDCPVVSGGGWPPPPLHVQCHR